MAVRECDTVVLHRQPPCRPKLPTSLSTVSSMTSRPEFFTLFSTTTWSAISYRPRALTICKPLFSIPINLSDSTFLHATLHLPKHSFHYSISTLAYDFFSSMNPKNSFALLLQKSDPHNLYSFRNHTASPPVFISLGTTIRSIST